MSSTSTSSESSASSATRSNHSPKHWKREENIGANVTVTSGENIPPTPTGKDEPARGKSIQSWVDTQNAKLVGQSILCEQIVLNQRWLKKFNRKFLENRNHYVPTEVDDETACELLRNDPVVSGVLSIHCLPDIIPVDWPTDSEIVDTNNIVHQSAGGLTCQTISIMRPDGLTFHFDVSQTELPNDLVSLITNESIRFIGYDFLFMVQLMQSRADVNRFFPNKVDLLDILSVITRTGSLILGFPITTTDVEAVTTFITNYNETMNQETKNVMVNSKSATSPFDLYSILEQAHDEILILAKEYNSSHPKNLFIWPTPIIWSQNSLSKTGSEISRSKRHNISQGGSESTETEIRDTSATIPSKQLMLEHVYSNNPKLPSINKPTPITVNKFLNQTGNWNTESYLAGPSNQRNPVKFSTDLQPNTGVSAKVQKTHNFPSYPTPSYNNRNRLQTDIRTRDIETRFALLINRMLDDFAEKFRRCNQSNWTLEYERFFEHYLNELRRCYALPTAEGMRHMERRLRRALTKKIVDKGLP